MRRYLLMMRILIPSLVLAAAFAAPAANAETYPINGSWTYENASGEGRAPSCGRRYQEFRGERRFDYGGAVPDYRNRGWSRSGDTYRLVDEFNNGQVRGKSEFELTLVDDNHIRVTMSGKTALLRRCG